MRATAMELRMATISYTTTHKVQLWAVEHRTWSSTATCNTRCRRDHVRQSRNCSKHALLTSTCTKTELHPKRCACVTPNVQGSGRHRHQQRRGRPGPSSACGSSSAANVKIIPQQGRHTTCRPHGLAFFTQHLRVQEQSTYRRQVVHGRGVHVVLQTKRHMSAVSSYKHAMTHHTQRESASHDIHRDRRGPRQPWPSW